MSALRSLQLPASLEASTDDSLPRSAAAPPQNRRVLLIDDMLAIHEDFRKILLSSGSAAGSNLRSLKTALFGADTNTTTPSPAFELDCAFQGQEGLEKLCEALQDNRPYAMAFVDMRMPPGWDGIETIERLWQADPRLQIVICTAYSDHSWKEVLSRLDVRDRLLILKKPFDSIEVFQLATTLLMKWDNARKAELQMSDLERLVDERTEELRHSNQALEAEIAERRLIDQRLRLMNRAVESSINAIFLTDNRHPDNPIEYINPAFEKMTGYSATEVIGKACDILQGESQDEHKHKAIAEAMREGRSTYAILQNYRKDGSSFWGEIYISPVYDQTKEATHFVGVLNDVTEARELEEKLNRQARYDMLTELPNRNSLVECIDHSIASARLHQNQVVVAFLDLDKFKSINDNFGHDAGDKLLREVAQRLLRCSRESDIVARLGGDEFILVLQGGLSETMLLDILQRFIDCVSQPIVLAGEAQTVTCSIGVSVFPQDGDDTETLVKKADIAMYQAKAAGCNKFQFFSSPGSARLSTHEKNRG